jgi:hypothetical protein
LFNFALYDEPQNKTEQIDPLRRAFSCVPGLEVPISGRRIMAFKPSSVLKARINGQAAVGEEDDA